MAENKCSCDDWEVEIAKIDGPILLAQARNPHLTKTPEFAFKAWAYCPWCGGGLTDRALETVDNDQ